VRDTFLKWNSPPLRRLSQWAVILVQRTCRFSSFTALAIGGAMIFTPRAMAADLKAPPLQPAAARAEPVRACPEYGPGFIKLPNTDICLRAAIEVTYEMKLDLADKDLHIETTTVGDNAVALYERRDYGRSIDRFSTRLDSRLNFTTVSSVGGEPVITFISLRSSENVTAADVRDQVHAANTPYVDQAWIKFAGVTAGRHPSYFDFSPGFTYTGGYASQRNLNLLAFTKAFAQIASVSVSVEDQTDRRMQEGVWASYGGQRFPDLVGQLRFTPSWGIVHVGAALHEINDAISSRSAYGYAVNAGIEYRQKWADLFGASAEGTYGRLLVTGAYAKGALGYLGIPNFGTDYVTDLNGRIEKTTGYSAIVSYEHVWRPNFKTMLAVSSYSLGADMVNYKHRVRGMLAQVGAEYMPVPGLMVGVEGDYFRDSVKGTYFGVQAPREKVDFFTAFAYIRRRI